MAQIRIACLVGRTNTAGITSWYWQPSATLAKAGWKAIALGKDRTAAMAAAEKRNEEVEAWKTGGAKPREVKKREKAGTFGHLLSRYEKEFVDAKNDRGEFIIARSTARTYRTALKRLNAWAGAFPLAYITPARVKALRKAMTAPESKGGIGHHAAHSTLKQGRQVFAFAESEDLIAKGSNPFASFGLSAPPPRDVIWSPAAREGMILAAYELGMPSMALAIMLGFATGQREADYLAMTQRHYAPIPEHKMQPEDHATLRALAPDGVVRGIRVRQAKTGAWIEIPVTGLVRWAIESNIATAQALGSAMVILDDTRHVAGDPAATYAGQAGQTRFQRDFAEVREWAIVQAEYDQDNDLAKELATLQYRDLRRTCVVYLGELGLDAHLIAAITGHDIDDTQRILKTYMPRTTGRAARAIALATARQAKDDEAREQRA
ncbi:MULTISPECIES: hypothetical protein [unclassified Novosphingobium]|uniref:hypothetical protein n=1 Tax=unclassified Novosphingobium TaxID=2644732 RepID=UPI000D2FD8A1|nr:MULTISPECIES: hypothetical protein [unclassified Novosphingobium]PTR07910.1 hypothetical protein C8K11_113121 [Novosphingobium sp. GV055]PUB00723.1 hypothetical protein C8K12_113121 [Novosphingobium sp. GV061]PUB16132.1 hypothetical protein C8K14_113121 [Novosphingobium sp. GV079]PUB39597.1 hypothetical protein C8K10_113121 [Novosphingobium sp. GV027]